MWCCLGTKNQDKEDFEQKNRVRSASRAVVGAFAGAGVYEIEVVEAKHLTELDNFSRTDPFVTVQWKDDTRRTKAISNNANPTFNQKCRFYAHSEDAEYVFRIAVWDKDLTNSNDFIGHTLLRIDAIPGRGVYDEWLRLDATPLHATVPSHSASDPAVSKEKGGFVRIRARLQSREEVHTEFWKGFANLVDSNEDGTVTPQEMRELLKLCGATDEEVEKELALLDIPSEGKAVEVLSKQLVENGIDGLVLRTNPFTNDDLDGDFDQSVGILLSQVDRSVGLMQSTGFITTEHASHGWFFALTEWVLPDKKYKVGKKPSSFNPVLVQNRKNGLLVQEFVPDAVSLALRAMYQNRLARLLVEDAKLLNQMSVAMGKKFDNPDSVKEIDSFVQTYGIDMSEAVIPENGFSNFNEFFYRALKPDVRPIHSQDDDAVAVSGADCRLLSFNTATDAKLNWIKGSLWSVDKMITDKENPVADELKSVFVPECAMTIFRLAPQDYHRVHFPVSGKIVAHHSIDGKLFTVNPTAIRENINVFCENKRDLVFMESPEFGIVCLVVIGATAVGSIVTYFKVGDEVKKGDLCNHFAYGGSTVIALFEKGRIEFDQDLLELSEKPLETLIRMGDKIGAAVPV